MRGLRWAVALTGVGAVVTCLPARAMLLPDPGGPESPTAESTAQALAVLEAAATEAQGQTWTGTERVLSMTTGTPVMSVVTVQHGPGIRSVSDGGDARLFSLLASHYDLRVGTVGWCAGRPARVVEAWRTTGSTGVAGRFWVDVRSGLLVRRDVLDATGGLVRRSDLVGVRYGVPVATTVSTALAATPDGDRLDDVALASFQAQGWPVVRTLPGGLELYDARWLSDGVLQLAYSDGLSTLSLFVQRGEMPQLRSGSVRRVDGSLVWQSPGEPERAAWESNGMTLTLVADVAPDVVDDVLVALPHTRPKLTQDGLIPRAWRGMSRLGSWLNPFN